LIFCGEKSFSASVIGGTWCRHVLSCSYDCNDSSLSLPRALFIVLLFSRSFHNKNGHVCCIFQWEKSNCHHHYRNHVLQLTVAQLWCHLCLGQKKSKTRWWCHLCHWWEKSKKCWQLTAADSWTRGGWLQTLFGASAAN
jgi:hypothetical protein